MPIRKINMGMVGGGPGSFIGRIHVDSALLDGQIDDMVRVGEVSCASHFNISIITQGVIRAHSGEGDYVD